MPWKVKIQIYSSMNINRSSIRVYKTLYHVGNVENKSNIDFVAGSLLLRASKRVFFHRGGVFWFLLPHQPNASRRSAKLRRGSGNNTRSE